MYIYIYEFFIYLKNLRSESVNITHRKHEKFRCWGWRRWPLVPSLDPSLHVAFYSFVPAKAISIKKKITRKYPYQKERKKKRARRGTRVRNWVPSLKRRQIKGVSITSGFCSSCWTSALHQRRREFSITVQNKNCSVNITKQKIKMNKETTDKQKVKRLRLRSR